MNVKEMINALREKGHHVEAYKRKDGSWLIRKIDSMTFSGATGNAYARNILGIELSQARLEQARYNVEKYIRDTKKPKTAVDEELKKELKKVQRLWRKKKVKGRITKKKLRWHIKEGGRAEAEQYLKRMSRYGQGYAYEENVEYLARYIDDVAQGITDKELKEAAHKTAQAIRERVATFKESSIEPIYSYWYEVIESHYDNNVVAQAITKTYSKF